MNIALWIVQVLLALLFLFAGGMKLVLPGLTPLAVVGLLAAFVAYGRWRLAPIPTRPAR